MEAMPSISRAEGFSTAPPPREQIEGASLSAVLRAIETTQAHRPSRADCGAPRRRRGAVWCEGHVPEKRALLAGLGIPGGGASHAHHHREADDFPEYARIACSKLQRGPLLPGNWEFFDSTASRLFILTMEVYKAR